MQDWSSSFESHRRGTAALRSLLVPALFLLLGLWFLLDVGSGALPSLRPVEIPAWAVDTTPVRQPSLRPEVSMAGYLYRCSECHALIPSPPETDRPLTQHRHIRLEHGINARCFNCHHREDRNSFCDDRGDTIPYNQPQLVCAKCHGPVYRDWTHGVHGRTNGHWSAAFGPMERRRCVECHDPHAPAFASLKPAPGPHTLRMGDPTRGTDGEETRNPLLIYRQTKDGAAEPAADTSVR